MKIHRQKLITALLMAAALYYAGVALFRAHISLPLAEPTTFVTTSCEEESLFVLWNSAHGRPVYSGSSVSPFSQAYFNWGFYFVYGLLAKALRHAGISPESWATGYRLLTLLFSLLAGLVAAHITGIRRKAIFAFIAIMSGFHPTYIFWPVTTRPDIMALFFEAAALAVLVSMKAEKENPCRLCYFILLSYLAWSTKHSAIVAIASAGFYYLATRQYRNLFTICFAYGALVVLTLWVGGPLFRYALLYSQASCGYSFWGIPSGLWLTVVRAPHVVVAIFLALRIALSLIMGRYGSDRTMMLVSLAFLCSLGLALVLFGKQGSGNNYFIPPTFWATVLLARWSIGSHGAGTARRDILFAAVMAFPLLYASRTYVNLRHREKSFQEQGMAYQSLRNELDQFSAPILVLNRGFAHYDVTGSLPWVQIKPPHLVFAYTYPFDREHGRKYEGGGIGNMIDSREIKTIAIRNNIEMSSFDGAVLDGFEVRIRNNYWNILSLK